MSHLFNYGSNYPERLADRLGRRIACQAAFLPGWRRVFRGWSQKWQCGVGSLVRSPDDTVYGYVIELRPGDLTKLDRFEGVHVGKYVRQTVTVGVEGDQRPTLRATAYVSTSTQFNAPSRAYLEACAKTVGTFWRGANGGPVTWDSFRVS